MEPLAEYRERRTQRQALLVASVRRMRLVGLLRLGTGLGFLLMLLLSLDLQWFTAWWCVVPVVAFVVLAIHHERVRKAANRAQRAVAFYDRGIERLEDRWQGSGNRGLPYLDDNHLYARDLDIFGEASLYQLLCTARTRSGENALAQWLRSPATRTEILARQEATAELRSNLDLREDLSLLGSDVRSALNPEFMSEWANAPSRLQSRGIRILAITLVGLTLVSILSAAVFGTGYTLVFYALTLEAAFALALRPRVREVLTLIEEPARELSILGLALRRVEREQFKSPRLMQLQANLAEGDRRPSEDIQSLLTLVEYLNQRRNEYFLVLSAPLMWATNFAFAIEGWRHRRGHAIGKWLDNFGEFEALCSLAAYSYEHPHDPFPKIVEGEIVVTAEEIRHPLLLPAACVPNSIHLGGELQLLLVSGSNMSGKSTLLRTLGMNVVLAMAGAPVRAAGMKVCVVNIGATLRVQDSLQAGVSRFYAEIQRLRDTMELTSGPLPVLFLLDEILHGTNSHDRAIGAEAVIRGLMERGAIGLVTTHDLALARVADALAPRAANVHFEDHLENGRMQFDYLLRPGVVKKSNALELMRAVGLPV